MSEARAFVFRERASHALKKAIRAGIAEETRRAWQIVARDWALMAEREAVKSDNAVSWDPLTDTARRNNASWRELEDAVRHRQRTLEQIGKMPKDQIKPS
jgi:hypothetical protein